MLKFIFRLYFFHIRKYFSQNRRLMIGIDGCRPDALPPVLQMQCL